MVEIHVPSHLKKRLKEIAKSKRIPVASLLARCLNAYCAKEGIRGEIAERPIGPIETPAFLRPKDLRR